MLKILALSLSVTIFFVAAAGAQQVKNKQNKKQKDTATSKPVQLKVGDEAPDWELAGSDGKTYKLSSFQGKKAVIVAWYPAALTGG